MKKAVFISIVTIGALAFLCLLALTVLLYLDDDKDGINRRRAETIIGAVYEFKTDHGFFPDGLKDLVPEYLERIPRTILGQEFFYRADSLNGFFLFWEINTHYGCGYTESQKLWECSGGD